MTHRRYRLFPLIALSLVLTACQVAPARTDPEGVSLRITRLLRETPLIDGHNDLMIHYRACKVGRPRGLEAYDIGGTVDGHTDLARWNQRGLGAQLINSGWLEPEPDLAGTLKGPKLFAELIRRGSNDADLRKLAGENFLRVLDAADAVAATAGGTKGG